MNPSWPGSGPWVIAATSADVDWRIAAAALAAAAEVPVAAVVVGAAPEPPVVDDVVGATPEPPVTDDVAGAAVDDPVRPHLAGLLELPAAGRLTLVQARDLVRAMTRAHGLVLVAAPAGLLVPLGRDDWTLADLATAVGGPAVVVTGPGPDAVNHTTLALGALAGHGIAASVVTIGEVNEAALPVTPAGRIPAAPDGFAGAAEWLDPLLRATAAAPPAPAPGAGRPATDGKRVVLGLLAVFVVLVSVVCGLAWWGRGSTEVTQTGVSLYAEPAPHLSAEIDSEPWPSTESEPAPRQPADTEPEPPTRRGAAADVCPQRAGRVAVTRPTAATTARVNKAWQRIEKWLAAHAPAGARALRPPAPAARIDELQRQMSVAFPPDLVASLRRHDGVSGTAAFTLPPFFAPSPLAGILRDWQVNCEVLADEDMDWTDAWWDKAFVPFAAAVDGGSLVVDQRPGGHGRVGEFYAEDGTGFERWPASVAELLERTATSLETGRPYGGHYTPRVVGGVLDWDIK